MIKKLIPSIAGCIIASPMAAMGLSVIFHPRHDWQWQTDLHIVLIMFVFAGLVGVLGGVLASTYID